jgi:hypothetical protein
MAMAIIANRQNILGPAGRGGEVSAEILFSWVFACFYTRNDQLLSLSRSNVANPERYRQVSPERVGEISGSPSGGRGGGRGDACRLFQGTMSGLARNA